MSDYPKTYDDANRLTSTSWSEDDENVLSSHAYTYDGANRRLRSTLMDGSYWDYAYNAKGEVTGAVKKNASGTPFPGLQYGYSFDEIGNRVSASVDAAVSGTRNTTYTSNELNQYTSIGTPNAFDVIGSAASSAIVKVNTETADRLGPYFRKEVTVNNSASAVWKGLNLEFTLPGAGLSGGDIVTQRAGHYYVAPATASPTYDEDGNLTSDSRWTYTWDGENRLIAMETTSAAFSASVPKRRLEFLYDGQSRRISKKVMDWNDANSAWITKDERRYVYDGWNLVAEVDTSGNLIQTHTWGMDLSGTAQGAGGVSGLLWSNDVANTQVLFAAYDGNGNVVAMISTSDSKVKARYDYNAFGETVLQEGEGTLVSNPYRFSTKYQDEETELYDYGYRYYNPTTGRWPSRDPLGEQGGVNLYGMVGNDAVNKIDVLGLQPTGSGCPVPKKAVKPKKPKKGGVPTPPKPPGHRGFHHYGNWGGPGWADGGWNYEDGLLPPFDESTEHTDERDLCYKHHDYDIAACVTGEDCPCPEDKKKASDCIEKSDKKLAKCLREAGINTLEAWAFDTIIPWLVH